MFPLLQTAPKAWHTIPLRLAIGSVFMAHGSQKLLGWFGGYGLQATTEAFAKMGFSPIMTTIAASGELFGGLFLLLGLLTRPAAFVLSIVMLTAIFKVHWGHFFLPKGMEYPFTLLGIAISLLISGGGAFSVDAFLHQKCCKAQSN